MFVSSLRRAMKPHTRQKRAARGLAACVWAQESFEYLKSTLLTTRHYPEMLLVALVGNKTDAEASRREVSAEAAQYAPAERATQSRLFCGTCVLYCHV